MKAHVVIGANYGDEGKGLMTDALVRTLKAGTVVRFNGGAQAGHTVVVNDVSAAPVPSMRHVFKHLGAGTLAGADTLLTKDFIVNPILLRDEMSSLYQISSYAHRCSLVIDWDAPVTTHVDMLINQALERKRSNGRHGSCGVGINETVERSLNENYRLRANDLNDQTLVAQKLKMIIDEYLPARMTNLGLSDQIDQVKKKSKECNPAFIDAVEFLLNKAFIEPTSHHTFNGEHVVFEGAQGLCLDQDSKNFPYVTRSKTGCINALDFIERSSAGFDEVTFYYVTRCYLTKHGAGFLPYEQATPPFARIIERTNVSNEFQGDFRFALLDVDALRDRIFEDLAVAEQFINARSESVKSLFKKFNIKVNAELVVTCVDQADKNSVIIKNDEITAVKGSEIHKEIAKSVGFPWVYSSTGPTALDVKRELAS